MNKKIVACILILCTWIREGSSWADVFRIDRLNGTSEEQRCNTTSSKLSPCRCDRTEVDCSNSALESIPNDLQEKLVIRTMNLDKNGLKQLPSKAFNTYPNLIKISMTSNEISHIASDAFAQSQVQKLKLNDNELRAIPVEALKSAQSLNYLDLSSNRIKNISGDSFVNNGKLEVLNLGHNQIETIESDSFQNLEILKVLILEVNYITTLTEKILIPLKQLSVLEINNNLLKEIPPAITLLRKLNELNIAKNQIRLIPNGIFQECQGLTKIGLKGNPISDIEVNAFSNLPRLKKLLISEAKNVKTFLNLNGTSSLEQLRFDRGRIDQVPKNLCQQVPRLKMLELKSNEIESFPAINNCTNLRLLDLGHNKISDLESDVPEPFSNLNLLHDLLLNHNSIKEISATIFRGLDNLQILDLSSNGISEIHDDAFMNLTKLKDVNLGVNEFSRLPEKGMESVVHLKTHNNPSLRDFPGPDRFPKVQSLVLSYAYHCCQFLPAFYRRDPLGPSPINDEALEDLRETIFFPGEDFDPSFWNNESTSLWSTSGGLENISPEMWENFGIGFIKEDFGSLHSNSLDYKAVNPGITCTPSPGPFMPCNDLFDWWALRCSVWIVFLLALLGNGCVVIVLVSSRGKMDVPRFLVCNLAMADFCMGIYLGFLAVVDASTLGKFRKYAIPWQFSAGCQAAGFFGVLSSELSVFTLAVITLERNYAITHAMHLNKRLSLKHAAYIMIGGWSFGIIMASLPLLGVSDYRKFAVCLPFETGTPLSLGYVVFLMLINGIAFSILMGCYLKMYCAIRGSQAWNSNDSRIAKRMALLVFTDFLCWAPIAFFALTAAFGVRLVSLEGAKVFTVFILPLNSCCNPFLYAILTKQFKKDCVMICKAVEESRVTRGIGRCRHSSNFSNRQTPANTNSLLNSGGAAGGSHNNTRGTICSCNGIKKNGGGGSVGTRKINMQFTKIKRLFFGYRKDSSTLGSTGGVVESFNTGSNDYLGGRHHHHHYSNRHRHPAGTGGGAISRPPAKRHASISSDNFSSSRSDSWKIHGRFRLDQGKGTSNYRRRNSWTVTRKPSQESQASRMDSASSNSTNTWRMSRSSVSSSEAGRSSMISSGGKDSTNKNPEVAPSTAGKFSALARNQLLNRHHSSSAVMMMKSGGEIIKPKLIRQAAILADEHSTGSSKSVTFQEKSTCPLHNSHLSRGGTHQSKLYGKLIESSHEADDEEEEDELEQTHLVHNPSRIRADPSPKKDPLSNVTTSVVIEGNHEQEPPSESDCLLSDASTPSVTTRTKKGYLNTDV